MQPERPARDNEHSSAMEASERRAYWDRWLWRAAQGRVDPRDIARVVLQGDDLCGVVGEGAYVALVNWASVDDDALTAFDFRRLHDAAFPRTCFCRRHSPMDYDEVDFSQPNVYRRLYYNDECISQTTETLFRRTPDIDLLRCTSCGDLWLRGDDQDWGRLHFLLFEPDDLGRVERDGVWPDGLDSFEDDWLKHYGGLGRHAPDLADWQAAHNTPDAMQRFAWRGP